MADARTDSTSVGHRHAIGARDVGARDVGARDIGARDIDKAIREIVFKAIAEGRVPSGTSVFIDGPAGIGKSHLIGGILDELAAAAAGGAAPVTIRRAVGDHRRRNDPFAAVEQLTGPPPPGLDPSDVAFDRIDQWCADGPAVIWLDDAHHVDSASITVLRRLIWSSRDLPLIVLISARPFPLREQLDVMIEQVETRLRLPPMDPMMLERLVFDRTGCWPGARLRRTLEPSGGNPLFAVELLRALETAGALTRSGTDTVDVTADIPVLALGLDAVIRDHLGQLDEAGREVLAALAVWGSSARPDQLATVMYTSAAALRAPLERAVSAGLIRVEAAGTVDFSHDLYREVWYSQLPEGYRRATHRRVAQLLTDAGFRPSLIAEHLLQASVADEPSDPQVLQALHDAVAASRTHAPEVAADLLRDAEALTQESAAESETLLLQRVQDLFLAGRGRATETLIRQRIGTVTDRAVAAGLQALLIRSLINRAEVAGSIDVIERTLSIPGLPAPVRRQMQGLRLWVLLLGGRPPAAAEGSALLADFRAAGDAAAEAALLVTLACAAQVLGDSDRAMELFGGRAALITDEQDIQARLSALVWPAVFTLARRGPAAALAEIAAARELVDQRGAQWLAPFLSSAAGGAAFTAGDWDNAVAELNTALESAEETGTGWISIAVGVRSYIDAHRGDPTAARGRLEAFRHHGFPLQFGQDNPGLAELAVLEAEGSVRAAGTLARTLWTAARANPGRWKLDLAVDVARVALTGLDTRLADQIVADLADPFTPTGTAPVKLLVHGMIVGSRDEIAAAAAALTAVGRHTLAYAAYEELACAAAAARDTEAAVAALDTALAGYAQLRAVADRDRALGRLRALGVRRGPREAHRTVDSGWASLTATERRIAALVREGLTNREIGTRLFISPRTVQTHVSHILEKTGLRSRVEVAAAARTELEPG